MLERFALFERIASSITGKLPGSGTTVALFVTFVYVAVSFGVHHLFPFFVFDMYTSVPDRSSRLIARQADGTVHDVAWYSRWDCPELPVLRGPGARCQEGAISNARDSEALATLRRSSGPVPEGAPVALVRRTVRVDVPNPEASAQDCVVVECRATR